jgi:large subunit ribosomal protein L24
MKTHIKKGEEVIVIAGAHKGKKGKVLQLIRPKSRVLVEGVAVRKKRLAKTQKNPQGGLVDQESTIHWSNVMSVSRYQERRTNKNK